MDLMSVYRQIGNRLNRTYQLNPHDEDLINLAKCRAIDLTHLYFLIVKQTENSFLNSSYKDSLTQLVYAASNGTVTDPLSLSPTLVLHILEDELHDLDQQMYVKFEEVDLSMREWFAGYRERRLESLEGHSNLPELRWSDLPNELFGLMPDS
ncbi:hypothetical protein K1Y37_16440 [Serratia marcescens]|uniref:hypothetical protein n=1 Tax=Serratia marcescens TaxID=615 RepID=UPI0022385528|nr:hypothetical protein [Serratia marcescens]MCW6024406.1 hypothetical protein [Serratia marcescens]